MNRFLSLLLIAVLIDCGFARYMRFSNGPQQFSMFMGYNDEVGVEDFPSAMSANQYPQYDGFERPRMPNGRFCCGGWGARHGQFGNTRWDGYGPQEFPSFPNEMQGFPNGFPNEMPPGFPNGFPNGFYPNQPQPFDYPNSFDERQNYFGQGIQNNMNNGFGQPNFFVPNQSSRISHRPPSFSSNEQDDSKHLGQGINSPNSNAFGQKDATTGLVADPKKPLGQPLMDSFGDGFDRRQHFKSNEMGQELTKGDMIDYEGKFGKIETE